MQMQDSLDPAAKRLRASQTDAETRLWRELRAHRFADLKFKRQEPLGAYIVDFVCYAAKVVIEVDGGQHVDSVADVERDRWLTSQGFRVLRFWNNEVLGQTEAVLARIFEVVSPAIPLSSTSREFALSRPPSPSRELSPSPLPLSHQGRGSLKPESASVTTSLSPRGRGIEGEGAGAPTSDNAPTTTSLSPRGRGIEGEGAGAPTSDNAPANTSLSPRGRGIEGEGAAAPTAKQKSTANKNTEKITGVILAGGQGSRMGHVDKGLQLFRGQPMVAQVLQRFAPQVDEILINANRNLDDYARFGYRVIADEIGGFAGPLAGLERGLAHASHPLVATAPCDSPFLPADLVARLSQALHENDAELAVAKTFDQPQPVFCLCLTSLAPHLRDYLAGGGRKIDKWYGTLRVVEVNFDAEEAAFSNINTLHELASFERQQ